MDTLDRNLVVLTWLLRGIEDLFVAFSKFDESFSRYRPFLNAMGFEMIAKSYLFAMYPNEYEGLEEKQAIAKIDKLGRKCGHDPKKLIELIEISVGKQTIAEILEKDFDGFTGRQFLDVIKAAYLQSRYPVPNPIHEKFPHPKYKNLFWDPLFSSGLEKFCFAFSRQVILSLKRNFGITLTTSKLQERVVGDAATRFYNLFFDGRMKAFVDS
jgi:hypothetical protein